MKRSPPLRGEKTQKNNKKKNDPKNKNNRGCGRCLTSRRRPAITPPLQEGGDGFGHSVLRRLLPRRVSKCVSNFQMAQKVMNMEKCSLIKCGDDYDQLFESGDVIIFITDLFPGFFTFSWKIFFPRISNVNTKLQFLILNMY